MYYIIKIKGADWPLFDGYCKDINDIELLERKTLAEKVVEVKDQVQLKIETLIFSGRLTGKKVVTLTHDDIKKRR